MLKISAWIKTVSITEELQISVSYHLYYKISSHLLLIYLKPIAGYLEYTEWSYIIRKEPYELKDGYISILNEKGARIDFNKETIKRYEYKY